MSGLELVFNSPSANKLSLDVVQVCVDVPKRRVLNLDEFLECGDAFLRCSGMAFLGECFDLADRIFGFTEQSLQEGHASTLLAVTA
jgi:hypothetical protein